MNKSADICVAGCSHIFGSDLDDCNNETPSNNVWPALVFGNNIVNLSKPGASCKTISRRIFLYLTESLPDLIVIQWPNLLRWEILDSDFQYCSKDFPYQTNVELQSHVFNKQASEKFKQLLVGLKSEEVIRSNLESILFINQHAKLAGVKILNLYSNKLLFDEWPEHYYVGNNNQTFNDWTEIYKKIAKNNGYNYFSLPNTDILVHKSNRYGDPYIKQLNKHVMMFPTETFDGLPWVSWCEKNRFPIKNNQGKGIGHYSEEAHKNAANILKHIKEL